MVTDLIHALIGTAPTGWEYIEYIFAGVFAIYIIKAFIRFLYHIFDLVKPGSGINKF